MKALNELTIGCYCYCYCRCHFLNYVILLLLRCAYLFSVLVATSDHIKYRQSACLRSVRVYYQNVDTCPLTHQIAVLFESRDQGVTHFFDIRILSIRITEAQFQY